MGGFGIASVGQPLWTLRHQPVSILIMATAGHPAHPNQQNTEHPISRDY